MHFLVPFSVQKAHFNAHILNTSGESMKDTFVIRELFPEISQSGSLFIGKGLKKHIDLRDIPMLEKREEEGFYPTNQWPSGLIELACALFVKFDEAELLKDRESSDAAGKKIKSNFLQESIKELVLDHEDKDFGSVPVCTLTSMISKRVIAKRGAE